MKSGKLAGAPKKKNKKKIILIIVILVILLAAGGCALWFFFGKNAGKNAKRQGFGQGGFGNFGSGSSLNVNLQGKVTASGVTNVGTVSETFDVTELETELRIEQTYSFGLSDAGSKMEAATTSNQTLTLLLYSMAAIVFIVGGIGIMNVLFVSVKERTNEIGILKALGCSRKDILMEFLLEASCISFVGACIGVLLSLGITPAVELFHVRVSLSAQGAMLSLVFGVITGTVFGFYPAYKASRLVPVVALNQE